MEQGIYDLIFLCGSSVIVETISLFSVHNEVELIISMFQVLIEVINTFKDHYFSLRMTYHLNFECGVSGKWVLCISKTFFSK